MKTLQVGALVLPDNPVNDLGFFFQEITDWYSISESKSEVRERPQAHGANDIDQDWRQSLAISVTCGYLGTSEADVANARRIVKRALALNVPTEMTFTDALGPTTRMVSIRRVPMPDDWAEELSFTIHAIAPDPRRYGPAEVVSTGLPTSGGGLAWPITYPIDWGTPGNAGRLTVTNPGDDETSTLFAVSGGLSDGFEFNHVENGNLLRFERLVPVGGTVYIDMDTGTAWLDDPANDVTGFLTRREFWSVPSQSSHQVAFRSLGAFTGTPTLTATTRPAY